MAYFDISWWVAGAVSPFFCVTGTVERSNKIGSKIGGSLSRPVEQFPQVFGSSELLREYPYFLPCAICSILLLTAWLAGIIFLRETVAEPLALSSLFKKKPQKDEPGTRRLPLLSTIFVPGVIIVASNLAAKALVDKFYSGTETLFLSTPIKNGGLGLTPRAIGTFESISSTVIGASQLFIFPSMHEAWGSKYVAVLGVSATLPRFVLWPLINWIASKDGYTGLVWFSLGSQVCCSVLSHFGFRKSFLCNVYG